MAKQEKHTVRISATLPRHALEQIEQRRDAIERKTGIRPSISKVVAAAVDRAFTARWS